MATPSSKHNPGTTPTHLASSPRPSAAPMARHLSHKSPSTRTPSASGGHGNAQNLNPSAHQYATPLGASATIDDPVTISSPSALLALGVYSGITPSPAAHDGLVGSGINESDINALGMHGLKLGTSRDSDEERRRHMEELVQILRSRVSGRGVCREGVERLGRLEGFESIWQEDSLNIAGNFVDLEIDFYPGQEYVKDVSLQYTTPEASEGERREEATAVLKDQLIQSSDGRERGLWKPLNRFHESLQWLARFDKLSQEVNCFEAIENLYASLRRVWEEESKDAAFSGDYDHLCGGWVGRPRLHKGGRIGFGLDYWVEKARLLDAKQKRVSPDSMEIDQPSDQNSNEDLEHQQKTWSIMIECETGYPLLRVSKDWVNSEVLTTSSTVQPSSANETVKPGLKFVNWADPPSAFSSTNESQHDPMTLDSGILGSPTPNRRFVARLDSALDVPVLVASDIYRLLGIQLSQQMKMTTYDGLLVPGWSPLSLTGTAGSGPEETAQSSRKTRAPVQVLGLDGKPFTKYHRYSFQAFESVAGRTLHDLPFSHPRQLTDVIPILRQYALLASFIQKIFKHPVKNEKTIEGSTSVEGTNRCSDSERTFKAARRTGKNELVILSNNDPDEDRLDALLGGPQKSGENASTDGDDIHVDITLRTQLGQAPVIMLLFTTSAGTPGTSALDLEEHRLDIASVSFEIGPGGSISIVDMSGLWDDDETAAQSEMVDSRKDEVLEMQKKMVRVLEISQDLGIFVEWVLRRLGQRKENRQ